MQYGKRVLLLPTLNQRLMHSKHKGGYVMSGRSYADSQLRHFASRVYTINIKLYPPYSDEWTLNLEIEPVIFEVILIHKQNPGEFSYVVDAVSCNWWPERLKLRSSSGRVKRKTPDNIHQVLELLQRGLEHKMIPGAVIGLKDRHIFDAVKYAPHK